VRPGHGDGLRGGGGQRGGQGVGPVGGREVDGVRGEVVGDAGDAGVPLRADGPAALLHRAERGLPLGRRPRRPRHQLRPVGRRVLAPGHRRAEGHDRVAGGAQACPAASTSRATAARSASAARWAVRAARRAASAARAADSRAATSSSAAAASASDGAPASSPVELGQPGADALDGGAGVGVGARGVDGVGAATPLRLPGGRECVGRRAVVVLGRRDRVPGGGERRGPLRPGAPRPPGERGPRRDHVVARRGRPQGTSGSRAVRSAAARAAASPRIPAAARVAASCSWRAVRAAVAASCAAAASRSSSARAASTAAGSPPATGAPPR
jgi:hypothetical protein